MLRHPRERFVHDRLAGPLIRQVAARVAGHRVAVGLESLDQTEASIERKRGDESARREPGARERFRQRGRRQIDPHPIVPGAVSGRIATGHQAGVRGQGDWCGRVRAIVADASLREGHDRRYVAARAVIGPQRIDGNEDDVLERSGQGGRRRLSRASAQQHERQD